MGRYDKAIAVLNKVVRKNARNAEAWAQLGAAYQYKGSLDLAETALRRSLH